MDKNDVALEMRVTKSGKVKSVEKRDMKKEAELLDAGKKDNLGKTLKYSPCLLGIQLLGLQGLLPLMLILFVALFMYVSYLRFTDRPVYILVVAILASMLPIVSFYQIYSNVKKLLKILDDKDGGNDSDGDKKEKDGGNDSDGDQKELEEEVPKKLFIFKLYSDCTDPKGKYYVMKTYASEIFEYISQILAISIYNCNFEITVALLIYFVIVLESYAHIADTIVTIKSGLSLYRLNRRITIDIISDIFTAFVPILLMYFWYKLPFSNYDFVVLCIIPAFFSLSKLNEVLTSIIDQRTNVQSKYLAQKKVDSIIFRRHSRRLSFVNRLKLDEDENKIVSRNQEKHTPAIVHYAYLALVILYAIFLSSVTIFQLSSVNTIDCKNSVASNIWSGCKIKLHFCNDMFNAECNCAIIDIPKHNMTVIPMSMFDLSALKIVKINDGPLSTIPNEISKLTSLKVLNFNRNKIRKIAEATGSIGFLKLQVANNNLNSLPNSVWQHTFVAWLEIDNNNISYIPDIIVKAKDLRLFFMSNNTLRAVPSTLFKMKLVVLNIDGNQLESIPVNIGQSTYLRELRLNNNKLRLLPPGIGDMPRVVSIDLRNNSLTTLPKNINDIAERTLKFLYLHANPLCSNGFITGDVPGDKLESLLESSDAGCVKQCSPYCQNRYLEQVEVCIRECNSESCDFHNGLCKAN